jgi:hypothetical protein
MDKHFLPEWLEKYPVFGLEMKLAWRRLKKSRIISLLSIKNDDRIANRIAKENLSTVLGCVFVSLLIVLCCVFVSFILVILSFPGEVSDYIVNSLGYMFSSLVYPLAMLLFVIVSVVQGSDCFHVSDDFSFYKQLATTGIKTGKICSELLFSGLSKFTVISIMTILFLIASSCLTFFPGVQFYRLLDAVALYIGYSFLSAFLFIVSSTFGVTRFSLVNRRFAVLGFWLLTVLVPVLIGYFTDLIYVRVTNSHNYELQSMVNVCLASIFPIGSLITYPAAIDGSLYFDSDYSTWLDYGFVALSLLCQVLYSLIALRIAQKLFARRLSE